MGCFSSWQERSRSDKKNKECDCLFHMKMPAGQNYFFSWQIKDKHLSFLYALQKSNALKYLRIQIACARICQDLLHLQKRR